MKPLRIALLWILLTPALSAYADDSNILCLGVVRADRTIVPFARFDGAKWSNPWPKGEMIGSHTISDTTRTLDTIPKEWYMPLPRMPREWHVQSIQGTSTMVTVTKPVTVYSWCETYWGLLIGNAPLPVDTHTGVPREGFATNVKAQTSPTPSVEKDSAEWNRIVAFIRPVFEKMEDDRGHPLPKSDRAKAEFSVVRLNRGQPGPDGRTIIHF